jgi:hypothetical protein
VDPPDEQRGRGEVLDTVTAYYVVRGAERVRRAAVAKARERLSGRAAPSRTTGTIKEVAR